jgi:predicted secreted protein
MSYAYANIFKCSLPIFIPLGAIFILCITFYNTKLNNIGDKGSPCCHIHVNNSHTDKVKYFINKNCSILILNIH